MDIDAIIEEINKLERQSFGVPATIPSLPELDQRKEKIEKEREDYQKKNPYVESGLEKARREHEEQKTTRESNPDSYWSQYGTPTNIITNTKTKRVPKRVSPA